MESIVKLMQQRPGLCAMKGISEEEITRAETALGLHFSTDYRQYVSAFGVASYDSHELTGICASKRLNVVDVTLSERARVSVPADWYVLEQTHIDNIVVWQSDEGEVYWVYSNGTITKVARSLSEYFHRS